MNILLTTTMALGVVFMLGANQPTEATAIQSVVPDYHHGQIIPVYWHGHHRYYDDGPYYDDRYYYRGGPGFNFHLGL